MECNDIWIHKNLEFAEFAAAKLVLLDPQRAGACVQLANMYMP